MGSWPAAGGSRTTLGADPDGRPVPPEREQVEAGDRQRHGNLRETRRGQDRGHDREGLHSGPELAARGPAASYAPDAAPAASPPRTNQTNGMWPRTGTEMPASVIGGMMNPPYTIVVTSWDAGTAPATMVQDR